MNLTKNIVLYEISYCMIKLKEKINYEDYYTIYSMISFLIPNSVMLANGPMTNTQNFI